MKRAPAWLEEEDELLLKVAKQYANDFEKVATVLTEEGWPRTAGGCKKRMYALRASVARYRPSPKPLYERDKELWALGKLWLAGKLGRDKNVSK